MVCTFASVREKLLPTVISQASGFACVLVCFISSFALYLQLEVHG